MTSLLASWKAVVIAARVCSMSLSTSLDVMPSVEMGGNGVTITFPENNAVLSFPVEIQNYFTV